MQNVKSKALSQVNARQVAYFLGLSGIATLLPFYIHLQWLTGPIINAILILLLFLIGIRSALLVCLIPSIIALSSGLLPAVLAPVVPFIMLGNVILVITMDRFYELSKNNFLGYWYGLMGGAFLKFAFLYLSVSIIGRLLIKQELTLKVAQMMSWPQFFTAVTGGFIAWGVLKVAKRL